MRHQMRVFLILLGYMTWIGLGTALAVSVTLHPSNQGIETINAAIDGTTITIEEIWTSSGSGFVQFDDLDPGVNYTVVNTLTNNSGDSWTRLANELLDPVGQRHDADDPSPQPSFVPLGFSTSSETDGLSFAQGSSLARTSDVFPNVFADEVSDDRDFLDFFGATLTHGETASFTFGIRDLDPNGPNQPFVLSQRPNIVTTTRPSPTQPIPEPATVWLMASGFLGVGLWRRQQSLFR